MRPSPPLRSPHGRRFGLCLLVLCMAGAGAARAETLADAVALAYQTNPNLLAARAQLRGLNEAYVQTRSNFGPQVSAEVNESYQKLTETGRTFKGTTDTDSVSLNQPLFSGGRVATAVQAAEADVRAGRERLHQAESDLMQRVVTAYVSVRRDQQTLAVARGTVTVLEQQLEETQAKFNVRDVTRTDLAQAQARLAAARAQVASFESQLVNSRAQYLNAVGQSPGNLAPEPDLAMVPATIDQAFETAEAKNQTLLAAKYAELGSRARVAAARAQYLPSVSLRLSASHAPSALYFPDPYTNVITAQAVVTQPLFTAGATGAGLRRALDLNTSDRLTIDATRRNVVQSVSQQWGALVASRTALVADQANAEASETAFFGMREEERFGLRSTIELLNAQQELTSAQVGLLRDRSSEFAARVGLLAAMGELTIDLLAPGTPSYDPVTDFDKVKNKGALPIELASKALDSIAAPRLGQPMAARETTVLNDLPDLPAAPPPAASQPPMRSVTELMDETLTPLPPPPPAASRVLP